jgi:hypothetical protein
LNQKILKGSAEPSATAHGPIIDFSLIIIMELSIIIIIKNGLRKQLLACTLNLEGRLRINFTRMQRPMIVAMLQCSTVGVKHTLNGNIKTSLGQYGLQKAHTSYNVRHLWQLNRK